MPSRIRSYQELLVQQQGVIARRQMLACGLTPAAVEWALAEMTQLYAGVYRAPVRSGILARMQRVVVRVTPRAKRAGVQGLRDDGVLLVKVGAPPEDGRANAEVCAVVAKALGLRARQVDVAAGHTSRDKQLAVDAPDAAERIAELRTSLG